jgi:xylan 1,4-beta-xylosidase
MPRRMRLTVLFLLSVHLYAAHVEANPNELVIQASSLESLRRAEGIAVDESVRLVNIDGRDGFDCSERGVVIETADRLSAASGGIEIDCRTPEIWPPAQDATLFHLGDGHQHITIFIRAGMLLAVYKGGDEHYAYLRHPVVDWEGDSLHKVEFSWSAEEGESSIQLNLRIDDQWIGSGQGYRISSWPAVCYLGERGPGRSHWPGVIHKAILSVEPRPIPELTPGEWTIAVNADDTIGECYNFWSIDNFTSEDMFADPRMRNSTAQRHPLMKSVNCVRLVGGRSDGKNVFFLGQDETGEPICDFRLLHEYIEGMQEWDYTPRLVLDNVPNKLSRSGEIHTYGNTDPPSDFAVWERYVELLMRSLVERFGVDVVRSWRIRVGTEPDLYPGHWSGTREDYFRHYDHTVAAVCRVIPDADIGPGNILNPAKISHTPSDRDQWGLDIIDHAATGVNYVTGETGTPLRHFSCSWYGRVGESTDSFDVAIARMRERLYRYPQFADVPVEVAEFSVLTDEQGRRMHGGESSEWSASWYAAIADRVYALDVAQVHNWGTGWREYQYPRVHTMMLMERMEGGRRLQCDVDGTSQARCGAIACRKNEKILLLVYNHRPTRRPKVAEMITIDISDTRMQAEQTWTLSRWEIDAQHGTFIHAFHADCEAISLIADHTVPEFAGGSAMFDRYGPASRDLFNTNREKYFALSQLPQTKISSPISVDDSHLRLTMEMPGHSVRLIELSPPSDASEKLP